MSRDTGKTLKIRVVVLEKKKKKKKFNKLVDTIHEGFYH